VALHLGTVLFDFDVKADKCFEAECLCVEYLHESFNVNFFIVCFVAWFCLHMMFDCDIHQLSPIVKNLCEFPIDKLLYLFPSISNTNIYVLYSLV
jgi:hypothetical protein